MPAPAWEAFDRLVPTRSAMNCRRGSKRCRIRMSAYAFGFHLCVGRRYRTMVLGAREFRHDPTQALAELAIPIIAERDARRVPLLTNETACPTESVSSDREVPKQTRERRAHRSSEESRHPTRHRFGRSRRCRATSRFDIFGDALIRCVEAGVEISFRSTERKGRELRDRRLYRRSTSFRSRARPASSKRERPRRNRGSPESRREGRSSDDAVEILFERLRARRCRELAELEDGCGGAQTSAGFA